MSLWDHWRFKYTEVQSQQMAFTQSPSLSINPKILNNSFSFTVGYMTNGKRTWWLDGNMAKWPQAYMIIWLYGQKALLPEARFEKFDRTMVSFEWLWGCGRGYLIQREENIDGCALLMHHACFKYHLSRKHFSKSITKSTRFKRWSAWCYLVPEPKKRN